MENLLDIILVSIGAILGANLRFLIYRKLEKIQLKKDLIILLINIFSSFLLGLFFSILPDISFATDYYQFGLFFSIGFIGSLSTFSTFIYDLFELFTQSKFNRSFNIFIISLTMGMAGLVFGLLLGKQ
ncbi:chromosome condensation protein CrcB [Prochlorococcus marinus XMU1408]|uniref:Fluoride-specific ion channel FluC n=1 Tax=Prochlorococcus marinus XMU1408 TaxID=2213228 RepID=A0A318RC71_PROMR|nr:chromosome condensation protein CrcB [Prochlorococcus marinus str. XMU1408]PYE00686.1 chromosome condensation protein CrcB [Prochlorococcus marinus XMU1408]